jgi:hypothetical protein
MNERPIARIADPRGPVLERMLAKLPPLRELTYRMALSGLSPHFNGDRFALALSFRYAHWEA